MNMYGACFPVLTSVRLLLFCVTVIVGLRTGPQQRHTLTTDPTCIVHVKYKKPWGALSACRITSSRVFVSRSYKALEMGNS